MRISHGIPHMLGDRYVWQISGDNPKFDGLNHFGFENVTLTPSIDASSSGHWHGFVKNGEII